MALVLFIIGILISTTVLVRFSEVDCRPTQTAMGDRKSDWFNVQKYPKFDFTPAQLEFFRSKSSLNAATSRSTNTSTLYRRECRTLPKSQLNALFNAIGKLMMTMVDGISQYLLFVLNHRMVEAPGAHYGPGFHGWHREYLARYQNALFELDPDAVLCYADWRMDSLLPFPLHSALWTDEYFGTVNGSVYDGFNGIFTNGWPLVEECRNGSDTFRRNGYNNSKLFTYAVSDDVANSRWFENISAPWNDTFEAEHGTTHNLIGGHMRELSCSPSDPVFFFHHCFIDYVYQEYRNTNPDTKDIDYPNSSDIEPDHRAGDQMKPFDGLIQNDGHSNIYESISQYVPPPFNCSQDADCESEVLWCYDGNCCAKVLLGGQCASLPDNACFDPKTPTKIGLCIGGTCQPSNSL